MPPSQADAVNEQLEIVTPNGVVIGRADRERCHQSPDLLHQAVHIFVYNGQGRLFLQKRSRFKKIQPDRWDTSVGGHVDPGESPLQAACREAAEELGLAIPPEQLTFIHRFLWRSEVEAELITSYRFNSDGPFTLNPDEIDDGKFYSLEELKTCACAGMLTPNLVHELKILKVLD